MSIGDGLRKADRRDKSRSRNPIRTHLEMDEVTYFKPARFGKPDLNSYIKQQRSARSHKMKITLAKRWEG